MEDLLNALTEAAGLYARSEHLIAVETEKPWMSRPLPHVIVEPVVAAIRLVPEIQALTGLWQLGLGSREGRRLYSVVLASALVKRTREFGSAKQALAEIRKLVEANEAQARIVMVLSGARVDTSIELVPGVHLVPFEDLRPQSWIENSLKGMTWPLSRNFDPVAPSAGLVMRIPFSPLFTTEAQIGDSFPKQEIDHLKAISHCISLASKGPPGILEVWFENDDPRLPLVSSAVRFLNPAWGQGAVARVDVAPEKVRKIYVTYQRFRGDLKPFDIAMCKLGQARSAWGREERVLNLGIALEVLLRYSRNGRSSGGRRIGDMLGDRASRLLGGSSAERQVHSERVRTIYGLRSEAVHTGEVVTKLDTWRIVDEEVEIYCDLVGDIIIAMLELSDWPNWDDPDFR